MKVFIFLLLILPGICIAQKSTQVKSGVTINMDKSTGMIRPLHGGNLGPVSALKVLDFTDFFKECKIPLVRLHDAPWFNTYAVDITTIFRDFRRDPSQAENYDFRQTDDYIAGILNTGASIIYRLGESIEWTKHKYNVNQPADNEKWAAICCGIIRHYNEGWAKGFHYNIKYWEIWNEPDCGPRDPEAPSSWTGTDEQFFHLYELAARTIKKNFPKVKVGGPGACHPVDITNGVAVSSGFADKFLSYCQQGSVPLDFYSWHRYDTDPWRLAHLSTCVRNYLNQNGFVKTESILDEWNYTPPRGNWVGYSMGAPRVKWYAEQASVKGGAFIANVLMLLQDEPIDEANLYTTTNGAYGMFSDMGIIHKSAYAFKAFAELANNTPVRIQTQYNKEDSLVICTGIDAGKTALTVLVSNFSLLGKNVDFTFTNNFLAGPITCEIYAVDESHDLTKVKVYKIKNSNTLRVFEKVHAPSVLLLKLFSSGYSSNK